MHQHGIDEEEMMLSILGNGIIVEVSCDHHSKQKLVFVVFYYMWDSISKRSWLSRMITPNPISHLHTWQAIWPPPHSVKTGSETWFPFKIPCHEHRCYFTCPVSSCLHCIVSEMSLHWHQMTQCSSADYSLPPPHPHITLLAKFPPSPILELYL